MNVINPTSFISERKILLPFSGDNIFDLDKHPDARTTRFCGLWARFMIRNYAGFTTDTVPYEPRYKDKIGGARLQYSLYGKRQSANGAA